MSSQAQNLQQLIGFFRVSHWDEERSNPAVTRRPAAASLRASAQQSAHAPAHSRLASGTAPDGFTKF
jgi:hypothetical protein